MLLGRYKRRCTHGHTIITTIYHVHNMHTLVPTGRKGAAEGSVRACGYYMSHNTRECANLPTIKCDDVIIRWYIYIYIYCKNGPTEKNTVRDWWFGFGFHTILLCRIGFPRTREIVARRTNDFELGTVLRVGSKLFDAITHFRRNTGAAAIVFTERVYPPPPFRIRIV